MDKRILFIPLVTLATEIVLGDPLHTIPHCHTDLSIDPIPSVSAMTVINSGDYLGGTIFPVATGSMI
jgi:hypothetical protein